MLGATHLWRSHPVEADGSHFGTLPEYAKKTSHACSDHNWPKVDPVKGRLARTAVPAPAETMKKVSLRTAVCSFVPMPGRTTAAVPAETMKKLLLQINTV